MKKNLLALALVAVIAVGCGAKDDGVDRLSKEDYVTQMKDKTSQIGDLVRSDASDKTESLEKTLDEMTTLNGPKDLSDKEEKIDDLLKEMSDLVKSDEMESDPNGFVLDLNIKSADILKELETY